MTQLETVAEQPLDWARYRTVIAPDPCATYVNRVPDCCSVLQVVRPNTFCSKLLCEMVAVLFVAGP